MTQPSLVWFRQDLRLEDQPALHAAIDRGEPIIPIYIWSPLEDGAWLPGGASRWWLHQSLTSLQQQFVALNSRLIVRQGDSLKQLLSLIKTTGAGAVYWTRRYEPARIARDTQIKTALRETGVFVKSFNGQLLFEPGDIQTKEGRPYQVFTSFWKSCLSHAAPEEPLPPPQELRSPQSWPASLALESLNLEPLIRWDLGMKSHWQPGATSAGQVLQQFLETNVFDYDNARDRPAIAGTSRLSPYLHFGEISPRTVWHETQRRIQQLPGGQSRSSADTFLKEVGWREFAHHLLFHFPQTPQTPLREEFSRFPWREDSQGLRAWQRGRTGFPLVDAAMRELWATGWMHNRARMIVASFLVKDLLIPWQAGAEWFWETLVDADLASNTLGWQWSAGCGADAAPYFRVFNPTLQSEKFDVDGDYIRRWVPELARLPTQWLHAPWTASENVLSDAGIVLGKTYPAPIVDHALARRRALESLQQIKQNSSRQSDR